MISNKKIAPAAIKDLAGIMASKNPTADNYLKGSELVSLFNNLGFPDTYSFNGGIGIQTHDYGDGLSRLNYTLKRLQMLNDSFKIPNTIQEYLRIIRKPQEAIESINNILGHPIQISLDSILLGNKETSNEGVHSEKLVGNIKLSSNYQSVEYSDNSSNSINTQVLGDIPPGHPVVFISYSWDSDEHKKWVLKLANDLTTNGIYVLLDAYLQDGTALPSFMELGIQRADKVLVVGTPIYKDKSIAQSGVGFEGCIITHSIYQVIGTRKFIPCLRSGSFNNSFPLMISGMKGHDFSNEKAYDQELESLCREIYNKPICQRPALGKIPDYAK